MKRLIILIATLALLLSSCGVKENKEAAVGPAKAEEPVGAVITANSLTLVYNPLSSLNPLLSNNRTNSDLAPLIFDSLYTLDRNLSPTPKIASTLVTQDNINFLLTIRSDIYLHSGRRLTAADVKYSIDTLRSQTGSFYYQRVSGITACEVTGENTLAITLSSPNGLLPSLLDFPIVPEGMADDAPDGSGRYRFTKLQDGGAVLKASDTYFTGEMPAIREIQLKAVKDTDEMAALFNAGTVNLLRVVREESATLDLKNSKQVASLVNNNLFYVGINIYRAELRDSRVRRAISTYADRIGLSDSYNGNRLYVAYTAFSPLWYLADTESAEQNDISGASTLLDEAGYSLGADGFRRSAWGSKLTLSLLVNADNFERVSLAEKLAKNLLKAGITVEVIQQPFNQYKQTVASGGFDLYIGEVKIQNDMNLHPLVGSGGALNYGGYSSAAADAAMNKLRTALTDAERKAAAKELTGILNADMPVIPLFFTTTSIVGHFSDNVTLTPTVRFI
jgi:peptide/nickel transport system substrate-binding protein